MIPSFLVCRFIPDHPEWKARPQGVALPDGRTVNMKEIPSRLPAKKSILSHLARTAEFGAGGTQDNFFDLGGYSLLAVRVVAKSTNAKGTKVQDIFQNPTIERLARVIEQKDHVKPNQVAVDAATGILVYRFI